jgi:hypothetical protein
MPGNELGLRARKDIARIEAILYSEARWAERWQSGLMHTPGKREWAYTSPGVRIPLSPPIPIFKFQQALGGLQKKGTANAVPVEEINSRTKPS